MARHQCRFVGAFQRRNSLAEKIRRHIQLFGRGPEAAYSGHFEKYPDQVPIRHSSGVARACVRTPALT
jgi:hypothetical protein